VLCEASPAQSFEVFLVVHVILITLVVHFLLLAGD
jgi:hypothetical protein